MEFNLIIYLFHTLAILGGVHDVGMAQSNHSSQWFESFDLIEPCQYHIESLNHQKHA